MPQDSPVTVAAPPEVDMDTSGVFAEALSAIDPSVETVVDCSGLQFIDSSGLRVLVTAHQARVSAGGSLRVINAPASMLRLLEITDLRHLLDASG